MQLFMETEHIRAPLQNICISISVQTQILTSPGLCAMTTDYNGCSNSTYEQWPRKDGRSQNVRQTKKETSPHYGTRRGGHQRQTRKTRRTQRRLDSKCFTRRPVTKVGRDYWPMTPRRPVSVREITSADNVHGYLFYDTAASV